MSKEIAKKENAEKMIQVYTETESMGVADNLSSSDVQMPSIMLMQANAELVKDRSNDIKGGDFVHSNSQEKWGSIDEPLELCVVHMFKTRQWGYSDKNEWIKTEPFLPEHENEAYEIQHEGRPAKRQKVFNYVCFRPEDVRTVELPNGDKHYLASPFCVKFKGASSKNAKKFNQQIRDLATFKQPSWCLSFDLKAYEDSNEHGSFLVYDMKKKKPTDEKTQRAAAALCAMIQAAERRGGLEVEDFEEKPMGPIDVNSKPVQQEQPARKNWAPTSRSEDAPF